ncbi:PREDICTED: pentatricopeptide repeat-containing protein At2g27610-like [Nelumbo nucifera]|uniref:Pentatricopeptide repeat-containing protein At2g27610-like n=2 Tax=Nelumbo nucifera TaxID=4432 RepID=A0A1U7YX66_NELNU|nr:PREDICTED: pentatricopeptide repeat-containing protein At2g27610-like [Nelumbo nucifera]DAD28772.1 TPA_asm: hypothetical protein HUJ06_030240 [Nelumbo nucifera]
MAFNHLLRVFGETGCVLKGRTVHAMIITSGFSLDVYTSNHLVSMYVKFGRFDDARRLLNQLPDRNLVSWTVLIAGYSQARFAEEALDCFRSMVAEGINPNHYTYVSAISACANTGAARTGKEVHGKIYRTEQEPNSFVDNCLVNLYVKCRLMKSAQLVFDSILEPNLVSWTSLLSGYCQCGDNEEGLRIFLQCRRAGVKANEFISASVLGACAALENLEAGMQVHSEVVKSGIGSDQFIVTGIIHLYAKCGKLQLARQAFLELEKPPLSSWTALIGGCTQQGEVKEAIDLFQKLHSLAIKPSDHTFSSILGGLADAMAIEEGKQIHSFIIKSGFNSVTFVVNSILDLYSKCGLLEESSKVFEEIKGKDVVSWNAMISGYIKQGKFKEAIELLDKMVLEGLNPSPYTYSSILSICGTIPAIEWGKQIHCCIIKPGFDTNVVVGSSLVDMYAKCGRISDAQKVFNNLTSKSLVSWNTMLVGYAQHGFGREALEIFEEMQREGISPNDITFLGVLSACGHVGNVEEGWRHFNSMIRDHRIVPRIDHYSCMVSLLTRKGQIRRAYEFIKGMPMEPDKVVWRCLLAGCKAQNDLVVGKYAAEKILEIDPEDASAHIMLFRVYAGAEMWDETAQVRKRMKEKGLKKDPGHSWIVVKNKVTSFIAGDNAHVHGDSLHEVVSRLTNQMIDAGYTPNLRFSHPSVE